MNFQEIIDQEHQMLIEAEAKYGKHFKNCIGFISLAQDFITEVKVDSWVFNIFLSSLRKHLVLSLFSALRLHHVQAFLDLRQVIEAGSLACYSLAFTDSEIFIKKDKDGILYVPKNLKNNCYQWLESKYPEASEALLFAKGEINKTCAHCNLIYAMQHSKMSDKERAFEFKFFDRDDPSLVKGDLWFISLVTGNLMDIFYGVNRDYPLLTFSNDFVSRLKEFRKVNEEIRMEMMSKERFKRWKFILEDRYNKKIRGISDHLLQN